MLFVALSEWLFWAEFGNRFDFIAVDYLVYTHEVIGNIKVPYPVGLLLTGLAVPAVLIATFFGRVLFKPASDHLRFGQRALFTSLWAAGIALSLLVNSDWRSLISNNRYTQELAGNGTYQFWHAFRHKENGDLYPGLAGWLCATQTP